ncbi:P-loop containing nucleoside triphosphate hydrolase protein [Clohesyomyces aquaticus]|uniref:DNA 3'-5' helicase n=1 Tax=Clohesyomyces aquaticus TaxID=1231657 RepID=A0A1Y1YTA5_9PLEO|nr:P-loop containing nucleoside triphosphate hydrolase protein [Clohesyomyces aquaticus]
MDALLEGLNAAQRSAVTSPASVLQVLAPPGSGKTKTLTARVAYLINHERLQPWNIVVCTFTIKAAREMKERIRGFVGDGIEAKLILGTFHSVARRFLIRYGQEIGIDKNFGIADTTDSKAIIKRIITRHQYTIDPSQARSRISGLKARGTTAEQFAATSKKADQHEFMSIYTEYEDTLRACNQLDYDDLLLRCTELLQKHPACVSTIQAVLIDEYQDTNNVQYELMTLMAQWMKRITIVGDPDQSIYSFRAAEIKNLLRMRSDYPDSIVINLEMNYRSSDCILRSAMAVIEQDQGRLNKEMRSTHGFGERPTLRHLATNQVEAQWIVEEICRSKTLTAGLLGFNDFAILVRSASLSLSIERALGKAGIPYRMVGGRRFFDRAEIKIVLDYLRVINQPEHNDALTRIINVPTRKIGEVTVKALLEEAETKKITLWNLILGCARGKPPQTKISPQAQRGLDTFVNLILTSRRKLIPEDGEECHLLDLISHVLQKISFQNYLRVTHKDNWEDRWANVEELVAQATQMVSITDGYADSDDVLPEVEGVEQRKDTSADTLSKFLANVALSTEMERPDGEKPEQVTISTIHAAKGLEWPIVFIPAVYDGSIPHSRAEDHDEERRLLYVGMTRAQALLYMSCPAKQSAQDETTLSKFLTPKKVQDLLMLQGPSFKSDLVQDLSRILRRPCPSTIDFNKAQGLVERIEDDWYPLSRKEIDGEEGSWGASYDRDDGSKNAFKRRKVETSTGPGRIKAPVTMHNTASYSISATTLQVDKGGFTSASTHHKILQEVESIRMLTATHDAGYKRSAQNEKAEGKATRTKTVKPRASGQGSITNFFARSGSNLSEEAELPATSMKVPSVSHCQPLLPQRVPLTDFSNFRSQSSQPSQPSRPYQPPSFSSHKLRNVPMSTKPKKLDPEPDIESTRFWLDRHSHVLRLSVRLDLPYFINGTAAEPVLRPEENFGDAEKRPRLECEASADAQAKAVLILSIIVSFLFTLLPMLAVTLGSTFRLVGLIRIARRWWLFVAACFRAWVGSPVNILLRLSIIKSSSFKKFTNSALQPQFFD